VTDDSTVIYEIDVSKVYKGNVGTRTTVATDADAPACGTSFALGSEAFLFVSKTDSGRARYWATTCGPATPTRFDIPVVTEQVYGAPEPPDRDAPTDSIASNGTTKRVTAVAGILALLGVIGVAFWRTRGRGAGKKTR
jgi:hypothetical protein